MKISEMIISTTLVIGAILISFMKNTSSSPILQITPTNNVLNVEASSTNDPKEVDRRVF